MSEEFEIVAAALLGLIVSMLWLIQGRLKDIRDNFKGKHE